MALRIGGGRPPAPPIEEQLAGEAAPAEAPAPEAMPEDLMSELPDSLEGDMSVGGSVAPELVHYMSGDERASAKCSACKHFKEDGSCEVVAGPIDPEGICNVYEGMDMPMNEMAIDEPEPPAEEMGGMENEAAEASQEGY